MWIVKEKKAIKGHCFEDLDVAFGFFQTQISGFGKRPDWDKLRYQAETLGHIEHMESFMRTVELYFVEDTNESN